MTCIRFIVEGKVIPKARPRMNRYTGNVYTPETTRAYEATIAFRARQAMRGIPIMTGPVSFRVLVCLEPPKSWSMARRQKALLGMELPTKKPDWDNLGKVVSDACNKIVYLDDAQITDAIVVKRFSSVPKIEVTISSVENK